MTTAAQARIHVAWATAAQWLALGLGFVASLWLATLLDPSAFGSVSLALLGAMLVRRLLIDGVGLAVVSEPTIGPAFLNGAFIVAIAIGVVTSLLFVGAAWVARSQEWSFGFGGILLGLSPIPLLDALCAVPQGLLQRSMRFKEMSGWTFVVNVVTVVVSIGLAEAGFAVWSLVIPQVLGSAALSAAYWARSAWRPSGALSFSDLRYSARNASMMATNSVVVFAIGRIDIMAIGLIYGTASTGLYSFSKRIVETIRDLFASGANNVAVAQAASLQGNPDRVATLLLTYVRYVSVLVFPVFVGTFCIADLFVSVLLGEKWKGAAASLAVLSLSGPAQILTVFGVGCLMGLGDRGRLVRFNVVVGLVFASSLVPLTSLSPVGPAWACVVQAFAGLPLLWVLLRGRLPITGRALAAALWDILLMNVVLAAVVLGGRHALFHGLSEAQSLFAAIALGAAAYGLVGSLFFRDVLLSSARAIRRLPAAS